MYIKEIVNKYLKLGHTFRNAQNLAAEEIVLSKIASSKLSEHVTLKGGIVMYNLSKSDRRVTQDIDFDFIRYSIDEDSVFIFVNKLNSIKDEIECKIYGKPEKLHHDEYKGVRVYLILKDKNKDKLKLKLDIGVHTHLSIEQKKLLFSFESGNKSVHIKANSTEQIFVEKLITLGRLGSFTTRYKDLYDMYYLITQGLLELGLVKEEIKLFLNSNNRKPNSINELFEVVVETLNDDRFAKEASKLIFKWVDVDYSSVKNELIKFLENILE